MSKNHSPLSPNHHRVSNWTQSLLLIVALLALVAFSAWILFGNFGVIVALAFTVFGLLFGRRATAAMVLKMYKAQPLEYHQAPELCETFALLCQRAELDPLPTLHYIPSRIANAFAVGQGENAAVGVTDGILRMMNPREMAGVLAHEITHIRCKDTTTMGIADIIKGSVSMVARIGFFMMFFSFSSFMVGRPGWNLLLSGGVMMLAPAAATMLQLALSRTREFNADRGAAILTGDARALASALIKLERHKPKGMLERIFGGADGARQPNMLRTHPPTDERVEALMRLEPSLEKQDAAQQQIIPSARRFEIPDQPRVRKRPAYHIGSGLWW
jgi:heat shock protein HtpX